jgi:hypothetical protein
MATAKKTTARRRSPQRRSSSDWYRVSEPGGFHADSKGFSGSMKQGELVRGSHPAVKAYPQFFERMDDVDRPEVESATAAPGEQR